MATYKTPGVYVEEISLFPPSVAGVETAVPAFIGYTEKALKGGVQNVSGVPTRVSSLVEFREIYGGPAPVKVGSVELDLNNRVTQAEVESTFYLFDALQLFFQNGGGKCYIVSIGDYSITPGKQAFLDGLAELKKQDEPTMILFPDAVLLGDDLYEVQKQALNQCAALGDRVTICDLLEANPDSPTPFGWREGYEDFRNKIGINNLKYAAAYTPYLRGALGKKVRYQDIDAVLKKGGASIKVKKLSDDAEIIGGVEKLDLALADNAIVNGPKTQAGSIKKFLDGLGAASLRQGYDDAALDFRAKVNLELAKEDPGDIDAEATRDAFVALYKYIYDAAHGLLDAWAGGAVPLADKGCPPPPPDEKSSTVICDIRAAIAGPVKDALAKLNSYNKEMAAKIGGTAGEVNELYAEDPPYKWDAPEWADTFSTVTADNSIYTLAGTGDEQQVRNMSGAEPKVAAVLVAVESAVAQASQAAAQWVDTYEEALRESFPVFKNILVKVSGSLTLVPPSGALAGVWAAVDNARGVWKAPANVSLNGVAGLTEFIDDEEQSELNVDVVAGKSINAIRPFTGRGIIVWGARTLAGNDNEWRYISVRRFFNMVEESVKKSTYWAVFEPNDANTWIKVKAMIENYLTQKWREGALAGAAASDAFFVKVGLGVTMTAQDILEGRMNVEIGMAVVRPAEFIILKFSHKMQES